MHLKIRALGFAAALAVAAGGAGAQTAQGFLSKPEGDAPHPVPTRPCKGPVRQVLDAADETVRFTGWNFSVVGGGGESGRFDPVPLLTQTVTLLQGTCLNAHFSAIVGSRQTYGVASITMFQVTLTPLVPGGLPQHMVGHYETPYGIYGPAVAIEAEVDVDTFGSNFYASVGTNPGDVPPGNYRVDVWWSGGPVGGGGAIGAAFVLKLYLS